MQQYPKKIRLSLLSWYRETGKDNDLKVVSIS